MTKLGIHPMVILWSSYGDPMVKDLFGVVNGVVWGRKRRCRVCGGFGRDYIKKLKKTRAGLRMSKKSCNFARNFAERRVTDRKTTINKEISKK